MPRGTKRKLSEEGAISQEELRDRIAKLAKFMAPLAPTGKSFKNC